MLPREDVAIQLDWPVWASPGCHCGETRIVYRLGGRPAVHDHRLTGGDPVEPSGGNGAILFADLLADRKMSVVGLQVKIADPVGVPELGVTGIEIEVHTETGTFE
jgi:hypothetical protein